MLKSGNKNKFKKSRVSKIVCLDKREFSVNKLILFLIAYEYVFVFLKMVLAWLYTAGEDKIIKIWDIKYVWNQKFFY